jgi:Zn-dependent protease with chaperone function
VDVNGEKVDRALVKLAAFENHDFVLRDEATIKSAPALFDKQQAPQKSHFRAMTHPLVYERGALANDVMRPGSTDLRVNIAATGGRH